MLVAVGGLFRKFEEETIPAILQMLQRFGNTKVVFDIVNKSGMGMTRKKYMKQAGDAGVKCSSM